MKKWLLISGLLLLVATNAIVMAHVAYNRSDEVVTITLTERELRKSHYSVRENSGQSLRLEWRTPRDEQSSYRQLRVSDKQLQELGFDNQSCRPGAYKQHRKEKEVWVMMELAGEAYRNDIAYVNTQLSEAEENSDEADRVNTIKRLNSELEGLTQSASRLYAIAVDANKDVLKNVAAGNKNRFLVKGVIEESYNCNNYIVIQELFVKQLNVPMTILAEVKELPEYYQIEISIGRLSDGWIKVLRFD